MTTPITTTADRLMELADLVKSAGQDSVTLRAEHVTALCSAIKAMAAERDALTELLQRMTEDRDSWEQQASDRTDDAVRFAQERDALRAMVADLVKVGDASTQHKYMGFCPDKQEGHVVRHDGCPACDVLVRAAKLLEVGNG